MFVLRDATQDERRLLDEQVVERDLEEMAVRREVIEQRRPLDVERLGQARDRKLQTLALENARGASGELSALFGFGGAGHG